RRARAGTATAASAASKSAIYSGCLERGSRPVSPLFDADPLPRSNDRLEEGALLLRGFAMAEAPVLLEEVARVAQAAPFRHLVTPGGYTMSVAMTNCGRVGWVSDRTGYRYDPVDPDSGAPW